MKKLLFVFPFAVLLVSFNAQALPGQSEAEVVDWIRSNSTLSPSQGERLIIRKRSTAAQRFDFIAEKLPPGKILAINNLDGIIRTERIELFDAINGVDRERLEKSLRTIYGLDIYQDFRRSQVIYSYPSDATLKLSITQNKPNLAARRGEVRSGNRYAYWIEVAQPQTGKSVTGTIMILLKEDIDRLETYLRNR